MNRPSLTAQREAVEWLLNVAISDGVEDQRIEVVKQACLSLGFLEQWQDVFKAVHYISLAFPDSYIKEPDYDRADED